MGSRVYQLVFEARLSAAPSTAMSVLSFGVPISPSVPSSLGSPGCAFLAFASSSVTGSAGTAGGASVGGSISPVPSSLATLIASTSPVFTSSFPSSSSFFFSVVASSSSFFSLENLLLIALKLSLFLRFVIFDSPSAFSSKRSSVFNPSPAPSNSCSSVPSSFAETAANTSLSADSRENILNREFFHSVTLESPSATAAFSSGTSASLFASSSFASSLTSPTSSDVTSTLASSAPSLVSASAPPASPFENIFFILLKLRFLLRLATLDSLTSRTSGFRWPASSLVSNASTLTSTSVLFSFGTSPSSDIVVTLTAGSDAFGVVEISTEALECMIPISVLKEE